MNSALPSEFVLNHRFDDFDAFGEAVAGWDLEFHQLDRGAFVGEMTQIVCGPVRMTEAKFSRKLVQLGSSPDQHWTFGVPVDLPGGFHWRGQHMTADHLIAFDPTIDMDAVSECGFHILAISIADETVRACCDVLGVPPLARSVGRMAMVRCDASLVAMLRQAAATMADVARGDHSVLGHQMFRHEMQSALPAMIVEAFSGSRKEILARAPVVRSRALAKALAVIDQRAHEPVGMTELCDAIGASGRTLRYAFADSFGMSPKAYLQAYRLNKVRRDLMQVEGDERIVDVANAWGFWHMGQFAADYKRLFGELPSQTFLGRAVS